MARAVAGTEGRADVGAAVRPAEARVADAAAQEAGAVPAARAEPAGIWSDQDAGRRQSVLWRCGRGRRRCDVPGTADSHAGRMRANGS